jgi:sensor histidine kinase YesM
MLAAITLGRSGVFGVWQALAPRYTTFSLLAVTSIYAVLVKTVFESKSRISTALLIVLSGAVLFSSALSYQKGLEAGRMTEAMRERAAAVLYNYESEPNQVLAMSLGTPSARVVKKYAPVLQELGYNVFSEPRARS